MCGICGILFEDLSRPPDHNTIEAMTRTMLHRGPDDEGYFLSGGIALGMRRLSIIDIEGGHQPFSSEDGKVYSICNGEIYNFKELKEELTSRGHTFRTRSDAEVLPHLYEEYGLDFVSKLNGMFGLALWDEKERVLVIARDRMGEKPIYWTHQRGMFVFASELKAILAHPEINPSIDRGSISKYLTYEYIPAPNTIFENVHKLEAGTMLIFKNFKAEVNRYWDIPAGMEYAGIKEEEAEREFLRLLELSIKRRLVSDVPLGVFLSGGIDSSTVTALASLAFAPKSIDSFSISFDESSFDESHHAKRVAEFFGTNHHDQKCTSHDLVKLLPEITGFLDEPIGDASIVPTYALSKFARSHVTVALGGDGADELFAGYPTFQAEKFVRAYQALPKFLTRDIIRPLAEHLPVSDRNISLDFKIKQFLKGAGVRDLTRHIYWTGSFSPPELRELLSFSPPEDILSDAWKYITSAGHASKGNRLLYLYGKLYLGDDILTKVDRSSMAASIEVRAPFLDHELVEFVARLPYGLKLKGFRTKYLLKKAVGNILPKGITARPKKGFGIPVAKWFKGELKKELLDVLSPDRIREEGFFKPREVLKLVKDHVEGKKDNRKKLWTLYMFENWLQRWG